MEAKTSSPSNCGRRKTNINFYVQGREDVSNDNDP